MTIYDISKKAGVSIATVSRVINGNENVSKKTRQKVLQIIEEVGFTPNVFARGLGLDTMHSVGLLCADCSDMFLAKAVYHTEIALRQAGYECILVSTGYELKGKEEAMRLLLNKRVDCILTIGSTFLSENDAENEYLRQAASVVPIIMLNGDYDYPNIYCTYCDDNRSTYDSTTYLIKSGCKKILYIFDSYSLSGKKKLTGLQTALLDADIPVDKKLIAFYDGPRNETKAVADFIDKLYSDGLEFDAISCGIDLLAIGAMKFARNRGLKVPEDISIIGYNNSTYATCCDPELTTVDNHVEKMSYSLVNTALDVLSGKPDIPQKIVFSGELVIRESTK